MKLWNFFGKLALFNMICNWFSEKPRRQSKPLSPFHDYTFDTVYKTIIEESQRETEHSKTNMTEYQRIIESKMAHSIDDADADELQDRIDQLEELLDSCDVMSDRYDRIQDEIDRLQDRFDDMEDRQNMYDDLQDEPDDLYEDLDGAEIDRDDDW
ncbi:MAG: hypothetical protein K2G52_03865 [Muribaculaceae bacterium]|nr:hypothetical protein [Muribaculaceae bacterium]